MENVWTPEMLRVREYLIANYPVKKGQGYFFELPLMNLNTRKVTPISNLNEANVLLYASLDRKNPYVIIDYFEEEPVLMFNAITFSREESLSTGKIRHIKIKTPLSAYSLDDVRREFAMLKIMLNSKAS